MSSWGPGPFDSDGALDYLSDLRHKHRLVDCDGNPAATPEASRAFTADIAGMLDQAENCPDWR